MAGIGPSPNFMKDVAANMMDKKKPPFGKPKKKGFPPKKFGKQGIMAKGDSTGASATPQGTGAMNRNGAIQNQLGMYPAGQGQPPGQAMGNIGPSMGGAFGGGMHGGWGGGQQQQQQNPLFQNMDPRLVQLFQKYNVNPTGQGSGNSDIGYWNGKMGEQGADQQYYLDRLEKDFQGTGMDLGNNHLTYGQGGGRQYQPPMGRMFQRFGGGNNRFPTGPRMGMGGGGGRMGGGGYTMQPNSPWGFQRPTPNTTPVPQPPSTMDRSEDKK